MIAGPMGAGMVVASSVVGLMVVVMAPLKRVRAHPWRSTEDDRRHDRAPGNPPEGSRREVGVASMRAVPSRAGQFGEIRPHRRQPPGVSDRRRGD
jgi:hypothetical protein